MTTTTAPARVTVKRHRVLAFFAGLMVAVGALLLLVVYGIVALTWAPIAIAALVGGIIGVLLVSLVPVRHR